MDARYETYALVAFTHQMTALDLANEPRYAAYPYNSSSRRRDYSAVLVRHIDHWLAVSAPHQNHWEHFFSRRTITVVAIRRCGAICIQHFDHPSGWTYGIRLQRRPCVGELRMDGIVHAHPAVARVCSILFSNPHNNFAGISGTPVQSRIALILGFHGNCRGRVY